MEGWGPRAYPHGDEDKEVLHAGARLEGMPCHSMGCHSIGEFLDKSDNASGFLLLAFLFIHDDLQNVSINP